MASISIYLDKRRPKASGKYPVRLRVFTSNPRRQKFYPTIFDLTEKEFNSAWVSSKPQAALRPVRTKLQAILARAISVASDLDPFTFEQFEQALYRKPGDEVSIRVLYEERISQLNPGTADTYRLALQSFGNVKTLYDITPAWLTSYEKRMEQSGRSLTTVSIYLRTLRAVFNMAIEAGYIDRAHYPFGRRRYQIPAPRGTKRALTSEQLKALFHAKPSKPEQVKARDFWFFSYALNGMNIKDIALLKYKDIEGDRIEFFRAKTMRTSKGDLRPITALLNDFTRRIINQYGNPDKSPESFVFDILKPGMTPKQQQIRIKAFTRFINQHIKLLCKTLGLPEISTYWARHSFATNAIRKGATMEFIQESLGHHDLKTTQHYFAGFTDDARREFSNRLMEF